MPEPITKHAFVDDNPYIAYTGEPETAVSGGSGGGGGDGGGSGIPIIKYDGDEYTCTIEYSTLKAGILSGDIVFGFAGASAYESGNDIGWSTSDQGNGITTKLIIAYLDNPEDEYIFFDMGSGVGYQYINDGRILYID